MPDRIPAPLRWYVDRMYFHPIGNYACIGPFREIIVSQTLGNKRQLIHRIAGIEGHVGSLKKMLTEDRESLEVLMQISAIRAGIERLSHVIFEEFVEATLQELESAGGERSAAVADIRAAIETLM